MNFWKRFDKISEHDIQTGNVMGPLLIVTFVVVFIVCLFFMNPVMTMGIIITIAAIALVLFAWFSWLPRLWNRFVDFLQR
jgi:ABC-type bacteriocin/lantibiotic exporter with double-glycine peptidase domain